MDDEQGKENQIAKPKHPGSENLRPFKPGQSGNPAGRPKGARSRSTIIREILERAALTKITEAQREAMGEDYDPQTLADQIAAAIALKAASGDVAAFNAIMDSGYGKLTDKVDNRHSFVKMGEITAKVNECADDAPVGKVFLSFDVGSDVAVPEDSDEDGE